MATNENVNKVIYGNQTVMDITDTTAEESDVASGEVFYKANGERSVGTLNADSAVWGSITGTLSDQTDLQIELNRAYTKTASETSSIDDLDLIPVQKISASSDGRRNIKFRNLKSVLKTYFDDFYSTFSGSYNDLSDKPTIPTVDQTYSATSSNAQSGKAVKQAIDALDKSDSAVSGQYVSAVSETDGIITVSRASLPTIPTVHNGQLTIQQNGTNKATFTANQNGNATANIVTDEWTATATVSSSGTVSFSGLNDSYGYKLYYTLPSGDSAYTFSKVTKSGSGTSVTLTYTTDAPSGTVCKLRILK